MSTWAGTKTVLVISAHAADFVWRAGGAIALYHSRGARVRVLCLSYGERGESQKLWRQDGMTIETVKTVRQQEAERAAEVLGAEIRFFDAGDYPLRPTDTLVDELVQEFRQVQPTVVLTHALSDPYNGDHPEAARLALNTRVYAQAMGYPSPSMPLGAPPVFCLNRISRKCVTSNHGAAGHHPGFRLEASDGVHGCTGTPVGVLHPTRLRRGTQAVRNSGNKEIKYAEAYQRIIPGDGRTVMKHRTCAGSQAGC